MLFKFCFTCSGINFHGYTVNSKKVMSLTADHVLSGLGFKKGSGTSERHSI